MALTPRENALVLPFYLRLMGMNAVGHEPEVWDELVEVGRTATPDDVRALLRDPVIWRPVVMGAWLSLRHARDDVGSVLLDALAGSAGSLTAPPLAVASVVLVGADAAESLQRSQARNARDGSGCVLDAALDHLGAEPINDVRPDDRAGFADLLAFGQRLRAALTDSV